MTTDTDDSIRSFEVSVDPDEIDDLRTRLERTRWPDQLPETGWANGTDREFLWDLCAYWRAEFDWAAFEDRCNEFDQYVTTIDGQRLHFYHVRSPEPDATPLVLSHGWPGSVTEFLDVLGPLTDPAAHGGDPADAFHVVAPSLPGFGFSGPTAEQGYDVPRIADAVADLMARLGYDRYVAQGGDWGALVAALLGANYPDRVDAIHTNMLFLNPSSLEADDPTDLLDERGMADYRETATFRETETAYHEIQATKPQSLAYGLTDSPAGLAGWIVEKFRAWSDCDGDLESWIDRDRLLDNLSVYWLTRTIGSSMRLYAETDVGAATPDSVDVPTGHARYPAEVYKTPRGWAEAVYDVEYWSEQPEGGHFAAMEVPELFVEDLRAFAGEFG
ncbi:epoxide hydrolase [Natrinema thermotolerans]|uniref:Epoxide hydrolase n=1 Tax=Natrinema thermotolerans TaxID=121872 RepID=A0AAF0PEU5_9EURY|nr:epoxide hydrolase family protein [Natrinema thermotolerans]QCC58272.1 epoxide hydrolase [Natrinema thermotolerans]WMT09386.1 epoxide hydrolase [Natrinema thermotolerans]